jgi:hypothetical protein
MGWHVTQYLDSNPNPYKRIHSQIKMQSPELLRAIERRLDALLAAESRFQTTWMGPLYRINQALDEEILMGFLRSKDILARRILTVEGKGLKKLIYSELGKIHFSAKYHTISYERDGENYSWLFFQNDGVIMVKRSTEDGPMDERTLPLISDLCDFLESVIFATVVLTTNEMAQKFITEYCNGPDWYEIMETPLYWDRLVGFLSSKDQLAEGIKRDIESDMSLIQAHVASFIFDANSGQLTYTLKEKQVVWEMRPLQRGVLARKTQNRKTTEIELKTVSNLFSLLCNVFRDIWFTNRGVSGPLLSSRDLTQNLMFRYLWV